MSTATKKRKTAFAIRLGTSIKQQAKQIKNPNETPFSSPCTPEMFRSQTNVARALVEKNC